MTKLPAGKLPPELLASLLAALPGGSPDVVVGAQPGVDAAVVDVGGRYLVLAMDPVTLSAEPGRFAVAVNANDVAVMGAEPRWLLVSVILPPGATEAQVREIMHQVREGSGAIGAGVIGGHSEVSASVTQPVVVACLIGEVATDRLVTSAGAQPGDAIILAGRIAVEGTAILAGEYGDALRGRDVAEQTIRTGAGLLADPGISVLPAVRALMGAVLPHAMHDPTEGGIITALREMAGASGVGVRVDAGRILAEPACAEICRALDLDPLGLLASGALLAAVAPEDVDQALDALEAADISAAHIATALANEEELILNVEGIGQPLPIFERDELARWAETASSAWLRSNGGN